MMELLAIISLMLVLVVGVNLAFRLMIMVIDILTYGHRINENIRLEDKRRRVNDLIVHDCSRAAVCSVSTGSMADQWILANADPNHPRIEEWKGMTPAQLRADIDTSQTAWKSEMLDYPGSPELPACATRGGENRLKVSGGGGL